MTTAADTFAAFLDTLGETLDLGADERARRTYGGMIVETDLPRTC